jgi:hypothetical protein
MVRVVGNARRSGSSACSGKLDGEGYKGEEDVWEVAGDGVSLFSQEGWPFIGPAVGTESDLELAVRAGFGEEEGRERSWAVVSSCGEPIKTSGVSG